MLVLIKVAGELEFISVDFGRIAAFRLEWLIKMLVFGVWEEVGVAGEKSI